MKKSINTLLVISSTSLVVACGGGTSATSQTTSNTSTTTNAVSLASIANPGVFAPASAASATFNLANCTYSGGSSNGISAGTGSLVVKANGDMTFTHPGNVTLAIQRVTDTLSASTASKATIAISAYDGDKSNRYSAALENLIPTSGTTGAYSTSVTFNFLPGHDYVASPAFTSAHGVRYLTNGIEFQCGFEPGTAIAATMGDFNSRIAAVTAGIKTTNQEYTAGTTLNPLATLADGNATWVNSQDSTISAYTRLNIATGQVSTGTSANGPFTAIDFAAELQASNGINSPYYEERREGTTRSILFQPNGNSAKRTRFAVLSGTDLLPFAMVQTLKK